MKVARGVYFDGRFARRHEVGLLLGGNRLKVVGADVNAEFAARRVRVSPRIGHIPRWIYLPDGATCVVDDQEFQDQLTTRESGLELTLHKWESRPAYAALALLLIAVAVWLIIDRGLPIIAEHVAERIPIAAESSLGEHTLAGMDQYVLKPSTLPVERQQTLRAEFARMTRIADLTPEPRLEFRSSPALGANAFTLPSGIIVITDQLIGIAHDDREILAVLGHELGHAAHRHIMRRLLQNSATALLIAGLTGDIASTTSIAATAPALLIQVNYSRTDERDADRYALELLQRLGIEARYFVSILQRLDSVAPRGRGPSFLSSHPATEERKALALAAGGAVDERNGAVEQPVAQVATAQPAVAAQPKPERSTIVELLARGSYEDLNRALEAYQLAFEHDAGTSVDLETAFASFKGLPPELAPKFDEWVAGYPSSYVAALARGNFYLSRAIDARGTKFSAETPESAMRQMREHFDTASADLNRSLALTEKPYLSHRYLLTVARYLGGPDERRLHYQEAIRWAPQSVETRLSYMGTLEPRWGGSYAQMEAFVGESRAVLTDPQSVRRLAARIPAYRGFEARHDKIYARALSYYDEANELDANADNLCDRAYVLDELKRYDEAFRDAGRAFELNNPDRRCTGAAVRAAPHVTNADDVIALMGKIIGADPSNRDALVQRGWRYRQANKAVPAFDDLSHAAKLGDSWAELEVSKMYWQGLGVAQDREQAVVWMRKAAEHGNADAKAALERYSKGAGPK